MTELGIQVHGGMGYVEETGVAQFYRDARIASIYEGTNGIQAIDLVGRKLLRDGGATVRPSSPTCAPWTHRSRTPARTWRSCARRWRGRSTSWCSARPHILTGERRDPELVSAAAFDYMMLIGTVIGGWQLARGALVALDQMAAGGDKAFLGTQVVMAQFYAEHVLPRCIAHAAAVRAGSGSTMALAADQF